MLNKENKKAFTGLNSNCLPEYTVTDDAGEPIVYLSKPEKAEKETL